MHIYKYTNVSKAAIAWWVTVTIQCMYKMKQITWWQMGHSDLNHKQVVTCYQWSDEFNVGTDTYCFYASEEKKTTLVKTCKLSHFLYRGMNRKVTSHLPQTAEKAPSICVIRDGTARHPSVSPLARGSDRGRDSTFALSARRAHPSNVRARVTPGRERGTLTRRSRLIWLFHLPTSCRPVRLPWHSNRQFAARTRQETRGCARFLPLEREVGQWRREILEVGTNPLRHFNYIRQSPVRWLKAPASVARHANENVLASGHNFVSQVTTTQE